MLQDETFIFDVIHIMIMVSHTNKTKTKVSFAKNSIIAEIRELHQETGEPLTTAYMVEKYNLSNMDRKKLQVQLKRLSDKGHITRMETGEGSELSYSLKEFEEQDDEEEKTTWNLDPETIDRALRRIGVYATENDLEISKYISKTNGGNPNKSGSKDWTLKNFIHAIYLYTVDNGISPFDLSLDEEN